MWVCNNPAFYRERSRGTRATAIVHGHRLRRTTLVKREEIGAQPSKRRDAEIKPPLASRRSAADKYCVRVE